VVRVSTSAGKQIFLSSNSAVHGEWSVAGGDDGEEDPAATVKNLP
jgi:hypothetical protein